MNRKSLINQTKCLLPTINYIAIDRHEENWILRPRYNSDFEIILIIQGEGEFTINDKTYQVQKDDLIFIDSMAFNSGKSLTLPFNFICIHFDLYGRPLNETGNEVTAINIQNYIERKNVSKYKKLNLEKMELNLPVVQRIKDRDIIQLFHKCHKEAKEMYKGYEMLCQSYLIEILIKISRGNNTKKEETSIKTIHKGMIEKSLNFIHSRYNSNLSVKELAAQAHLSTNHFSKLFKEYTNFSPQEYLQYYRINESKRLLEETNHKIEWIAFQCGFSSSQYYIRIFKKYEGITPYQFQQNIIRNH